MAIWGKTAASNSSGNDLSEGKKAHFGCGVEMYGDLESGMIWRYDGIWWGLMGFDRIWWGMWGTWQQPFQDNIASVLSDWHKTCMYCIYLQKQNKVVLLPSALRTNRQLKLLAGRYRVWVVRGAIKRFGRGVNCAVVYPTLFLSKFQVICPVPLVSWKGTVRGNKVWNGHANLWPCFWWVIATRLPF